LLCSFFISGFAVVGFILSSYSVVSSVSVSVSLFLEIVYNSSGRFVENRTCCCWLCWCSCLVLEFCFQAVIYDIRIIFMWSVLMRADT
jgi:hypothetical protein